MSNPTAKEVIESIRSPRLDSPVDDIDIAQVAKVMTDWEEMAPFLGLTPAEENEIVERYRDRLRLQKREALRRWKQKNGNKATYRKLIITFCAQGQVTVAEAIKDILLKSDDSSDSASSLPSNVIPIFHDYLVDCYSSLPHPSSLQWPSSRSVNASQSSEAEQTYVELNLVNAPVRLDVTGAHDYHPVTLKSLFSAGNSQVRRKVILIEGVAGAGKTTLSWYAFKEWAKSRMFEDIKLLIHVSLSNPSIHSATKLADLIPHPSEEMRSKVANAIASNLGKGVCFWFDGCDEAPGSLWTSFLSHFVKGSDSRTMLPYAHIVLTSRPGFPLDLTFALTGKVIIRGLHSLRDFFATCTPDKGEKLIEALTMKPALYSLCHLPLNASILAYLHDVIEDNLPTTRTGLFDPLIRHVIARHMLSRTSHQHPNVTNFPANLPADICSSFVGLSKLAFHNILHRRRVFDQSEMTKCGLNGINDGISFLRACIRFTMYGPTEQFSFTHLSFQEYLAAFYISQMDQDQQVRAIKIVLDQTPNSPVLAFYAGLTKLAVNEVREIFLKVLSKPYDALHIAKSLGLTESDAIINPACDLRLQLLCMMNGLYEAQNPDLFTHINLDVSAKQVEDDLLKKTIQAENILVKDVEKYDDFRKDVTFVFSYMYLLPNDCLSLGYFIRNACGRTENRVYLDLSCAILTDIEFKALAQELQKPASSHNVYLNINMIFLFRNYLLSLSTLFNPDSCLMGLETTSSVILDKELAMKILVEGFARSHCRDLTLGECAPQSIHYLILMLKCQLLHILNITYSSSLFATQGAMRLFSEALKYSRLARLTLSDCSIDEENLKWLAVAICHEECLLVYLDIDRNPYTDKSLECFLTFLLRNLPTVYLRVLSVNHINDKHQSIVTNINFLREKYLKYPALVVGCGSQLRSQNEAIQEQDRGHDSLMRFDLAFQNFYQ